MLTLVHVCVSETSGVVYASRKKFPADMVAWMQNRELLLVGHASRKVLVVLATEMHSLFSMTRGTAVSRIYFLHSQHVEEPTFVFGSVCQTFVPFVCHLVVPFMRNFLYHFYYLSKHSELWNSNCLSLLGRWEGHILAALYTVKQRYLYFKIFDSIYRPFFVCVFNMRSQIWYLHFSDAGNVSLAGVGDRNFIIIIIYCTLKGLLRGIT